MRTKRDLPLPNGERVAAKRPGEGGLADVTKRRPEATERARDLRADDTEPEYRLWSDLRARRLNGYKFVRQIPPGPYIVDFLCREQHLIIELDGGQHSGSEADVRRTEWLNAHGYSVLRFWNDEVLRERRAVLETILAALEGEPLTPSPGLRFAPATLSPMGRGGRQSPAHEVSGQSRRAGQATTVKEGTAQSPRPIAQPRFVRCIAKQSPRQGE
jgi:very-short-patch-repair endonuclease